MNLNKMLENKIFAPGEIVRMRSQVIGDLPTIIDNDTLMVLDSNMRIARVEDYETGRIFTVSCHMLIEVA